MGGTMKTLYLQPAYLTVKNAALAQQKCRDGLALTAVVLDCCRSRAYQIAHRLVRLIRDPHLSEFASTM
jgi:hypothetical protein